MTVICDLLGVPEDDRESLVPRADDLARMLDPLPSPEIIARADASAQAFNETFAALVEERRDQPRDDLLSALITAHEGDDRLTRRELLAFCSLLVAAGFETTMNLIGNGTLALLRHPEQLEYLRAHPARLRGAVEELLR